MYKNSNHVLGDMETDIDRQPSPTPSQSASHDPRSSIRRESKGVTQASKDLNVDKLAKKIMKRLHPQGQLLAPSNPHLYPRRYLVLCGMCNVNQPSNECP